MRGEGEGLYPGGQLAGQRDDRAPDLVWGEVVQRQVGQSGVLGTPDAVLAAGPSAVPELQVCQLALPRRGGKRQLVLYSEYWKLLRSGVGTVAARAKVKAVQRMLGHASAAMTLDIYPGL